ncbi:hypothetical protein D3C76_1606230 [compost metagenome]
MLLQPANLGQECNEQANLLEHEWSLVICAGIEMGNTLAKFIYCTSHTWLICRAMMKRIVNVANSVI